MTSIPVPIMPNALFYIAAFAVVLVAMLVLVAVSKSFRKLHLAVLLIPVGIVELVIMSYYYANSYYIPHQVFIISVATITTGATIPVLYAARNLLDKTIARIVLFFLGLVGLLLAVDYLPSFRYFYPFADVVFVIVSATVGICFIVTSILLSVKKRVASGLGWVKKP